MARNWSRRSAERLPRRRRDKYGERGGIARWRNAAHGVIRARQAARDLVTAGRRTAGESTHVKANLMMAAFLKTARGTIGSDAKVPITNGLSFSVLGRVRSLMRDARLMANTVHVAQSVAPAMLKPVFQLDRSESQNINWIVLQCDQQVRIDDLPFWKVRSRVRQCQLIVPLFWRWQNEEICCDKVGCGGTDRRHKALPPTLQHFASEGSQLSSYGKYTACRRSLLSPPMRI